MARTRSGADGPGDDLDRAPLPRRSVLDRPELSARLFFPRRRLLKWPFHVQGDGFRLACRRVEVAPELPTVIHFHGGRETVADGVASLERWLLASGVNLLLAEYRGYGMSTGVPSLTAALEDVELIIRAAGVEPGRLIFFGRSLGGLCAAHAAGHYPGAAGLILEGTPADPLEILAPLARKAGLALEPGALEAAVEAHLQQRSKLMAFRGRTLILHARRDRVVPVSHGQRLHDWAGGPRELVLLERGDHDGALAANPRAYIAAVRRLVSEVPRGSP